MARKLKEGNLVGGFEKASYGMYFLGQNIIYGLVALNVQSLFSDVGITAAAVGVIVLITKAWDAINDPLFGILIDKIRFKRGRFMPWIRISLPLIAVTSMLLFAIPTGASLFAKIAWAILAYVAWDISYTLCDVPIFVLPTSMTDNTKERTGILALGRYLAIFGILGTMIVLPTLQAKTSWLVCGIVFSVLGALFMIPICFSARERHIVRPEKEVTIRQMVHYVAGNRYLLIYYVGMFISNLTNFAMTVGLFFARYNLGDQTKATIINLISMAPLIILGAFIPMLTKKYDKFYLYIICSIAGAVLGVLRYFVGYDNYTVFLVLAVFQGIFASVTSVLIFMFTPDCLEYGTYHTGERAEGIAASVQTFFTKLIGSVGGPLAMFILAGFGFLSGESAVQTATAQNGIWMCMTLFPAIGVLIAVLWLRRYKLRDKAVQIMSEYNNGKISQDDANAALADKYGPAADLAKMTISHD